MSANCSEFLTPLESCVFCAAQWHFFRAYSASKASCVLGDLSYASHVANVLGKPLLLSPGAAAASTPQNS
ncbi:hypothetical protein IscW_ISCW014615 [Ixodes scapularis]|uniref:Uncharacterized protein n=1 Tax=Ixodes scapularis TaxID=6945 RepID=B7QIQ9_IXOSC|nr:hypothetical protein IscW_ISCW014615 [Ixodes scapularis]|eukprot:XP_002415066.1 hypothetical protein IscW_ISCW014615 [Ixodes scapularis]